VMRIGRLYWIAFAANKEVNNVIVLPFRVSVVHLKEEVIKE